LSPTVNISIDVMGGDFGPHLCIPAALKFLAAQSDVSITLVGKRALMEPLVGDSKLLDRISFVHAEDVVEMSDKPGLALRHKRGASMWQALKLVADGHCDACVSGGNTGALMAIGRHLLKTVEGISRPAICKSIPTASGKSFLLDLGATLECSPEQLLQFALMGSALSQVDGVRFPRVSLLNVGAENSKGSSNVQLAAALLEGHKGINFSGFVEGSDLFAGHVDVIVCDGFIGNVALKVGEGTASFILGSLRQEFAKGFARSFVGVLVSFALKGWWERFNPQKYNGAALVGLRKVVVKSHGGADEFGFQQALHDAYLQVRANIPKNLEACLLTPVCEG